ncbi:MAG: exopolyphosphatase, partial [Clostridia bacterium]|nr:exopolyphosphatase [Clostridia bacterium]
IKLGIKNYDSEVLHHLPLPLEWVKSMADKLFSMTVEERLKIAGIDAARADVIAGATYLLYEIMKKLSCKEVYFSDSDNLEGYLSFRGLR